MRLPVSSRGAARSEGSRGRGTATTERRGVRGAMRRGRRGVGEAVRSSSVTSVLERPQSDDDYDPELEEENIVTDTEAEPEDLWERGPTGLPPVPTREEDKIVLTPEGDTQWDEEKGDSRLPNGILGVLIREGFPGIINYKGRDEPAWKWQHYNISEDVSHEGDVRFNSALERVEESFWWWFKWIDGKENEAKRVVRNVVKKLIPQMFYEGRIQSVITYYNHVLGKKIKRLQHAKKDLTVEEYMQAIPWWAQKADSAWRLAAELRWCNEDWKVKSRAAKTCREKMEGPSQRQGSASHARWKKKLAKEKKRPISDVEAYASGRKGDQDGTFCNPNIARKIEAYTEAARNIHGPEFDAMNSPIDLVAVYKAGHGKKHGRYLLGDGFINTPSTLSDVRASASGSQEGEHPQRHLQIDPADSVLLQQEIETRKVLEEKLEKQMELTVQLQQSYNTLAQIIHVHLNIPIPPLVPATQTASSHQGISGGSSACPQTNMLARDIATNAATGDVEHRETSPDEAHVGESLLVRPT